MFPGVHVKLLRMLTENSVLEVLKSVKYPGYNRDIVSFGLIKGVAIANGAVTVTVQLTSANVDAGRQIKQEAESALRGLDGLRNIFVEVRMPTGPAPGPAAPSNPFNNQTKVGGIGKVIAVASGKGGVGKSTVSVNLACALQQLGHKVGLLDCDIYGPSIPLMMGIRQRPTVSAQEMLEPPVAHGVKLMSMGFIVDGDQPVIWRGPMIMKTIQQFIGQVAWGELDYLLVDLPPGTGDAQLSLCQTVALEGGVIVTTPQEASLGVVRKGIAMFQKVNVPILGIVENMSYFLTPQGERIEIFGHGGGRYEAARTDVAFLGEVPIFTEIRIGGDQGVPIVVSAPQSAPGQAFFKVAEATLERVHAAK